MLSDLVNLDDLLQNITFDDSSSQSFRPYEQLMACLPPSSSYLLPKPYQWLMNSSKSPIIDFYPKSFTVDMNGKRWPWEAVVLLPFIDSKRLIAASQRYVTDDLLTESEKERNEIGMPLIYKRDKTYKTNINGVGDGELFGEIPSCHVRETKFCDSKWQCDTKGTGFRAELLPGCEVPYPGFPTLKDAPIKGLSRRRLGIDVFGMRSRYRTAVLELDDELPVVKSAKVLAKKFIGTTVYFRYPFLHEGFVTAVSDEINTFRGDQAVRTWTKEESKRWKLSSDTIQKMFETGEGMTGSGGWSIPQSFVTLSVRPLKEIQTLPDGSKVKVYARLELQVPLAAALWCPSRAPLHASYPARLEKDPYRFTLKTMLPPTLKSQFKRGGRKKSFPHSKKSIRETNESNEKTRPTIASEMHSVQGLLRSILPDEATEPPAAKIDLLPPLKNGMVNGVGTSNRKFHSAVDIRKPICKNPWKHELLQFKRRQRNNRSGLVATTVLALAAFLSNDVNADIISNQNYHGAQISPTSQGLYRSKTTNNDILYGKNGLLPSNNHADPSTEFFHGTTTLSFVFDDGIVVAVDSRASIGNFVGSKTTQKVLPINDKMLGTMAGGAADCSFWIRKLQAEARLYQLSEDQCIPVSRASRILADWLYANRALDLSVGSMVMGYDDESGPSIYYIDNNGTRIKGDIFSVGSGSTFALGVLDTERLSLMKEKEALSVGIKAIRHATFRDAFSGGYIAVYIIDKNGWRKAFSEDLAMSGERNEF